VSSLLIPGLRVNSTMWRIVTRSPGIGIPHKLLSTKIGSHPVDIVQLRCIAGSLRRSQEATIAETTRMVGTMWYECWKSMQMGCRHRGGRAAMPSRRSVDSTLGIGPSHRDDAKLPRTGCPHRNGGKGSGNRNDRNQSFMYEGPRRMRCETDASCSSSWVGNSWYLSRQRACETRWHASDCSRT
jgi:hypothetical protein